MGLGGHITWTPLIRAIDERCGDVLMYEGSPNNIVYNEIFSRFSNVLDRDWKECFKINMSNPNCIYLEDLGDRVKFKPELHMTKRILKEHGFPQESITPTLHFDYKKDCQFSFVDNFLNKKYLVIEPHSKTSFTENKKYSFEKWQYVVNKLCKDIEFVQVGEKGKRELDNVTSLVGELSFLQSALVIRYSDGFVSTEGGLAHAATAVGIPALVLYTGYQPQYISEYPRNFSINISTHDEYCGLKKQCKHCEQDIIDHDPEEIVQKIAEEML